MGVGYTPEELWGAPGLKTTDLAVYAALESFCSRDRRECYPSQALLQRMTLLKERGLRQSLGRLAEAGFIRVTRNTHGGLKRGNTYHLRPARNGVSQTVQADGHTGTKRGVDRHQKQGHTGTRSGLYTGTKSSLEGVKLEGSKVKALYPLRGSVISFVALYRELFVAHGSAAIRVDGAGYPTSKAAARFVAAFIKRDSGRDNDQYLRDMAAAEPWSWVIDGKPFRPTLEWLCRPSTEAKHAGGAYQPRTSKQTNYWD